MRVASRIAATSHLALLALPAAAFAACSDPAAPREEPLPPLVFVGQDGEFQHLFRLDAGVVTRLTSEAVHHRSPGIAAGRIVFESNRNGNQDIFYATLDEFAPRQITSHTAGDHEPDLRPDGGAILFMSYRSGTPRIWIGDTLGGEPSLVATGSASFVPEGAPRWSPDGLRIAFTSGRTGTSQIWMIPASGGDAVQLSRESAGAFDFTWSQDGNRIIYVTPAPAPRLRSVGLDGGDVRDVAADPAGLHHPECIGTTCVAVRGPLVPGAGELVRLGAGGSVRRVAAVPVGARQPAMLR